MKNKILNNYNQWKMIEQQSENTLIEIKLIS
jgi:hypothetical protein